MHEHDFVDILMSQWKHATTVCLTLEITNYILVKQNTNDFGFNGAALIRLVLMRLFHFVNVVCFYSYFIYELIYYLTSKLDISWHN